MDGSENNEEDVELENANNEEIEDNANPQIHQDVIMNDESSESDQNNSLDDSGSSEEDDQLEISDNDEVEDDARFENAEEEDVDETLRKELAILVRKHSFSREATNNLLSLFRRNGHSSLPLQRDTLCKAPRHKKVPRICRPGHYIHFGIQNVLQKCNFSFLSEMEVVTLDFNMDGLSLSNSSQSKIWPIMAAFPNRLDVSPIVVGAYFGYKNPASVDDFLSDFVQEMSYLLQNGVRVTPRKILKPISVRTYICDAPARAFITGTLSHTSNVGCGKCDQRCHRTVGTNKRVYSSVRCEPRTDHTFKERLHRYHHQPEHRNNRTMLEHIGTNMVSQVVLDPMHLLDEGVYARMLKSIFFGPCNALHFRNDGRTKLDDLYVSYKPYVPKEFERKPRSIITGFSDFKAVEFRFGLLYAGVVMFKNVVGEPLYKHFLKFFVAVRLLSAQATYLVYADFAQQLLDEFVAEYSTIYDPAELVYNVHGVMHIVDDARKYGPLYSFSAYRYENHMREIKKLIKKPQQVLQQLYRRFAEIEAINETNRTQGLIGNERQFENDIFPGCNTSYKGFKYDAFVLQTNLQDSCCMLSSGIAVEIQEFTIHNGENVMLARKFYNICDFFTDVVSSKDVLGILLVDGTEEEVFMYKVADVKHKFVRFPYKFLDVERFVLIPMLHHLN